MNHFHYLFIYAFENVEGRTETEVRSSNLNLSGTLGKHFDCAKGSAHTEVLQILLKFVFGNFSLSTSGVLSFRPQDWALDCEVVSPRWR